MGIKTKQIALVTLVMIVFTFVLATNVFASSDTTTLQSKIDNGTTTITLDDDYTGALTIAEGKTVTLDLNGHILTTTGIEVKGSLTIKDSGANGKITSSGKDLIDVDGGSLTVVSGTLENKNDYGIYALNGGTVTVNGGTINSYYAPLTGNNTTGAMTFKVNGGTLTATYGPAVYMPGPISLDITGGTFNGGISLRMGKVNISGGTFNAITNSIDSPAEYYNYSGNAWLPDALYVFGGTYTTNVEGQTNALNLNITGGTFNCTNGQGSAVVIYDLGKVAQTSSVKIAGSAVLNTNSSTRSAYQVLSFSDIGVTSPATGYNNPNYIGKVVSEITGGTYSTSVEAKYIADGYKCVTSSGKYTVSKVIIETIVNELDVTQAVTSVTTGVANKKVTEANILEALEETKQNDTSFAEKIEGKDVTVTVEINNTITVTEEAKAKIEEAIQKIDGEVTTANYFDVTIAVKADGTKVDELTNLSSPIKLVVAIPEDIQTAPEGYTRTYYIIREHNGVAELLETTLAENGTYLTFESDKFSTFALAYTDVKTEGTTEVVEDVKNPQTGDNIAIYFVIVIIAAIGIGTVITIRKNRVSRKH